MLNRFKKMIETLKENDFDSSISIEITKDGKIEIETPVRSYRAETLEKAISRVLENLQDDIDDVVEYSEELENTYQRDRHSAGIGSW